MHRTFLTSWKYKTVDLLNMQPIETFPFAVEPAEDDPKGETIHIGMMRQASRYSACVERQTAKIRVEQDK